MQFILKHDHENLFYFAAIQSPIAQKILNQHQVNCSDINTVYYLEDNKVYCESDAALKIANNLKFPINLFSVLLLVPHFIRDGLYRWISKNRLRLFGKTTSCWLPSQDLLEKEISAPSNDHSLTCRN